MVIVLSSTQLRQLIHQKLLADQRLTVPPTVRLQYLALVEFLLLFSTQENPLNIDFISLNTGVSRSSVQPILASLHQSGYIGRVVTLSAAGTGRAYSYYANDAILIATVSGYLSPDDRNADGSET